MTEMIDMTGEPRSEQDLQDAIQLVTKLMVRLADEIFKLTAGTTVYELLIELMTNTLTIRNLLAELQQRRRG